MFSGNKKLIQVYFYRISGMFQFRKPIYFVRDPKLVKRMAVKDFDYFVDHRVIIDDSMDKLFGKALISLQGQKWRGLTCLILTVLYHMLQFLSISYHSDMRATLSPMFTGSKMRQMFDYVANVGKQTATTMKEQIRKGGDDSFEFKALAMKFTVDTIATCAFGIEVNSFKDPDNEFHEIATKASNFANFKTSLKFAGFLLIPSVMKALKIKFFSSEIEEFFQQAIKETMRIREEKGIIRYDMINLLMQAKKGKLSHDSKEEQKITEGFSTVEESKLGKTQVTRVWDDDDLVAQGFIFFLAGFDTVSFDL